MIVHLAIALHVASHAGVKRLSNVSIKVMYGLSSFPSLHR